MCGCLGSVERLREELERYALEDVDEELEPGPDVEVVAAADEAPA